MKKTFFTPGPSQLYPTVSHHVQTAIKNDLLSMSHRSQWFQEIYKQTVEGLKNLLQIPEDYFIVFVSSGTEAMERVIENSVDRNSFHFINGSFSKRWFEIAKELGKDAKSHEVELGKGFSELPKIPQSTELICFTHNETSTGVAIDPSYIYQVGQKYPKAILAVDTVSSSPYVDLDYRKLDCVFFSVQKLFGLPAGLGVIILSPKAVKKAKLLQRKGVSIGSYHNFPNMVAFARDYFTPETPNVLGIYVLGQIVSEMNKQGIANIRSLIEERAQDLYSFFDQHVRYKPFVKNSKDRSQTVITIHVGKDAEKIKKKLKAQGIIVGNGYGPLKDSQIRITNFPALKRSDIDNLFQQFKMLR